MTDRAQRIADIRSVLDWLATHPDVPMSQYGAPWDVHVGVDERITDDEAGIARIQAIARLIDGKYSGGETHFYARRRFGTVTYEASYIRRQHMADYSDAIRIGQEVQAARRQDDES